MTHLIQKTHRAFPLWTKAFIVAVVAAAALLLAARPAGFAADKDDPAPKASPLDFVPADAVAVVSVRVAELWKHPAAKALRDKLTEGMPDAVKAVRGSLGVGPEEIDRVTAFEPLPGPGTVVPMEPLIAVTTLKPYDQKAILAAAAPDAKEQKAKDRSFYLNVRGPSFAFLDDHTFVMGRPEQLEAFLKQPSAKLERPLEPVLKLADSHLVAAGVDVAAVMRAAPPPENLPPDAKPFKPLFKAQLATLTVDLDDKLQAVAQATFATEADAQDGAAAVDDALDMARAAWAQAMKQMGNANEAVLETALVKDIQTALRSAKARRTGTEVEVQASLPLDPAAAAGALMAAVERVRLAAKRIMIANDLKQLVLAMHGYTDANGHLPSVAIDDKNGKPLLSWRVALLPYIGEGRLYREFHLDEPWDSDHNKKLLEKMPTIFAPPDSRAFKDHETHFQVLVGTGTVFEKPGLHFALDVPDGTSNTIMLVEAKKAVPWTKPEDIPFDDDKLLPKVGGLKLGVFMAAMCDGSVRTFPLMMKEETLRIWVIRNSGQVRPDPDK